MSRATATATVASRLLRANCSCTTRSVRQSGASTFNGMAYPFPLHFAPYLAFKTREIPEYSFFLASTFPYSFRNVVIFDSYQRFSGTRTLRSINDINSYFWSVPVDTALNYNYRIV